MSRTPPDKPFGSRAVKAHALLFTPLQTGEVHVITEDGKGNQSYFTLHYDDLMLGMQHIGMGQPFMIAGSHDTDTYH